MELRIPRPLILWIDELRFEKSRQAFIINELCKRKEEIENKTKEE